MYEPKLIPVNERWSIVFGADDGSELRAVELLVEGLATFITEYTPEIRHAGEPLPEGNLLLIGANHSNPHIDALIGAETLPVQGYRLKVMPRADVEGRQIAVISGADRAGLLYGCVEFLYHYLPGADCDFTLKYMCYANRLLDCRCKMPDAMLLPETDLTDAPKILKRGLWTWGHAIFDVRSYLDNMLKLKMNEVIVWNDFKPLNGKEFVEYAHRNGIEVIWGFSWAWGVEIDLSAPGEMERWKDIILAEYRDIYADMGGDGIYFQTFTETDADMKDGKIIAEEAVKWVNYISDALLKEYPALRIQFGLHATSVNHRMDTIARTDPRVEIIWENCGDFPYSYSPADINHFDKTVAFTDEMIHQRAEGAYGAVLKGLIHLDWSSFEYKTGPYIIGSGDKTFRQRRADGRRRYLRYIQSGWLTGGDYARRIISQLANGHAGHTDVTFLVEDGLFEENLWYPVALAGEMLWNADRSMEELTRAAARRPDVVFA